jgi:hypothetical protein
MALQVHQVLLGKVMLAEQGTLLVRHIMAVAVAVLARLVQADQQVLVVLVV